MTKKQTKDNDATLDMNLGNRVCYKPLDKRWVD